MCMPLSIDAMFDGGNIRVVETGKNTVDLAIECDRYAVSYQWFYFRLSGATGQATTLRIINAGRRFVPKWLAQL